MRVLMTTDAVGGVWQYSLALARGLVERHGCRVALVCFGEPSDRDLAEAVPAGGVELLPLQRKLEWMPDSARDVEESLEEVGRLVAAWQADLLHTNQFCFGALKTRVPRVVVAHSDVLSWIAWHRRGGNVHGLMGGDEGFRGYARLVAGGLAGASAVVCPSHFMARAVEQIYGCRPEVIHNGLWPDLYPPQPKAEVAVVAGRLWDEAKRAATAVRAVEGLPVELRLLGPAAGPSGEAAELPAGPNVRYPGSLTWAETRAELGRARYYLATSSYEPFGLSALEAALCGCAILANDLPSYREIWGEAALFYRRDDPADLHLRLSALLQTPGSSRKWGAAARERALARFTADRMAAEYYRLYTLVADG